MSDLVVYGFPRSTFVNIVRVVLTHKEVTYTFHDLEPEMGKPSHLELHPFNRVPILRHGPGVDDLALQVDEIHVPVLHEVRSKQRKSRKGALRLARAQPNAPSFEGILLDRGHERATSNEYVAVDALQKMQTLAGLNISADVIQPILWHAESARAVVVRLAAS